MSESSEPISYGGIIVYWGGEGLPGNHMHDCWLRFGAQYEFLFTDGTRALARFRSFDGAVLDLEIDGVVQPRAIGTLEQIFAAPGNGAWGQPLRG